MAYFGTTDVLGNAGVWTSPARPTDTADNIVGLVFSDQTGTLNIEQSADGTNYDLVETVAVTGGTGTSFSKPLYGSTVRLRYVNGATPQTVFRINARFSSAGIN
jgi:hypothetical protein